MNRKVQSVLYENLHIGQIVRMAIEEKGLVFAHVARLLNLTSTGMHHRLANPTYSDVYDLIETSLAMEVDLFSLVFNELNKRYPDVFSIPEHEVLQKKVHELRQFNQELRFENDSLYKIIAQYKNGR